MMEDNINKVQKMQADYEHELISRKVGIINSSLDIEVSLQFFLWESLMMWDMSSQSEWAIHRYIDKIMRGIFE